MSHPIAAVRGTVYEAFGARAELDAARAFLCILPRTATKYGIEPRSYTYGQAAEHVEPLRRRYAAAGFAHGHRAALLLGNEPSFFFHWLALNALGVCVVPLSAEWRSAEFEFVLGHSDAALVIAPRARHEELAEAARNAGCRLRIAQPDLADLEDRGAGPWVRGFAHLGSKPSNPRPGTPGVAGTPGVDSECALLYTSGTTGRPKGCVLTNEYFLWAGAWYAQVGGLSAIVPGAERLITPLPMSHMNAMAYSTMAMLLTAGCIVPLDRFHPATWWEDVRESRATIVHYLGVMPAMLLAAPPDVRDRSHRVRFAFGAGVSPQLHAAFENRFGFPLLEAWAMTETGAGAVVIANREPRKVGTACFGRPEATIEYRIVDDNGQSVPAGEAGELLVRAAGARPRAGFFREYLKDEAATDAAWRDGYFHTGDIVRADAEGDLHFVDRKKNVIRRSGENISAVEVEGVLVQHPRIAAVGVTAVPDDIRGDEVMACVVPRQPIAAEERATYARDVLDFCMHRLAYFKAPGYVAFCEQLPLTSTEKIQRARLKELAQTLLAAPSCIDVRALKKRPGAT